MKFSKSVLLIFCVVQLVPEQSLGEPQGRNDYPYGTKLSKTNQAVYPAAENLPVGNDQYSDLETLVQSSSNFYDPSYGFSQASIAAVMSQGKGLKDEPVLPVFMVNSKDYYTLYNNYKPKAHKNNYPGKDGYQLTSQDVDVNFSENINRYPAAVPNNENSDYNKVLRVNENFIKGDKRETVNGDVYEFHNIPEDRHKNYKLHKVPPHKRPQYNDEYRPHQQLTDSPPRRPQLDEDFEERQRTLEELLEESKALTEQIQRLKARTEEMSVGRVRQVRGPPHRWSRPQ